MSVAHDRQQLLQRLFPDGAPRLWCPPLTHYRADGALDVERHAAHLQHMDGNVGGILVPGSTGDGWEMAAHERRAVLEVVLPLARAAKLHVLIGILNTDADAARREIIDTAEWLRQQTDDDDPIAALAGAGVCGFTVCPPHGAEKSQAEIHVALAAILELGFPTALYQLPQVTENEMAPETVAALADQFANFFLFKDTSGADRVASAGLDFGGVFLVRGAEGDYARWPRSAGGPYDGFLLSTANCFAQQYADSIRLLDAGEIDAAIARLQPIERVVANAFAEVTDLPDGNPFTNANKAIDHCLAQGQQALNVPPPRLHAGSTLPTRVLQRVAEELRRERLQPDVGYLGGGYESSHGA